MCVCVCVCLLFWMCYFSDEREGGNLQMSPR